MSERQKKNTRHLDGRWIAGLAIVLGAFGLFCSEPMEGNQGNLQLSYDHNSDADDPTFHPLFGMISSSNLVAGGKMDFRVGALDSGTVEKIEELTVTNTRDFSTHLEDDISFTLSADDSGETVVDLLVEMRDGQALSDHFDFSASEPTALQMQHSCEGAEEEYATYLTDSQIRIGYALFDDNDSALSGYGIFPIEFTGPAELTLNEDSRDLLYWEMQTGLAPGNVVIESTLDATKLTLELAEPGEIDGAEIVGHHQLAELGPDEYGASYLVPTVRGQRVCYADAEYSLDSLTPDVCEISVANEDIKALIAYPDAAVLLTRHTAGECQIEVTYPAGDGGQGAVETIIF